jgi:hypothetical protein
VIRSYTINQLVATDKVTKLKHALLTLIGKTGHAGQDVHWLISSLRLSGRLHGPD